MLQEALEQNSWFVVRAKESPCEHTTNDVTGPTCSSPSEEILAKNPVTKLASGFARAPGAKQGSSLFEQSAALANRDCVMPGV
jgi:hypothetical protein